ncbi:hypothetical protein [Sphingomonas koreensis]|jgi:hypothetical protein|uniref:Uncharacterized protein n=1 Tax=Sphingomonas koreensis TaxID=93064 RepID=A0A1L6JEI8_9SPHN|nr:hypothetical protein [Sphingomonas koreensis]APR54333.1 hypothetical protein BRX40_19660 [Sphingomonas koreensis]MDC7809356.1 hypothetical protein [Sphingomonas koreensis]
MSRWPDPDTQLERALVRGAAEAGIALHVESAASTPWASVTFTGASHRLRAVAPASPALDIWLATLSEAEFRLRGHLVADLAVAEEARANGQAEVTLEILTVEDC